MRYTGTLLSLDGTMYFLLISIAAASPWSEILSLREEGRFEQEYRRCETLIAENHSRKYQCQRRNAALDERRDLDASFGCLESMHNIQHEYIQINPQERWDTVLELYHQNRCRPKMRGDILIWILRESIQQKKEESALSLLEEASIQDLSDQQTRRTQALRIDLLARLHRWKEAKELEQNSDFFRSQQPAEGIFQRSKEHREKRYHRLSWFGMGSFFMVNLPAALWVIRRKGIGTWSGWWLSLLLVFLFAVIALLYAPHSVLLWLSLAASFVIMQWCTAHAWYASERFRYLFSLVGAVGVLSVAWQILCFFGETSWIY